MPYSGRQVRVSRDGRDPLLRPFRLGMPRLAGLREALHVARPLAVALGTELVEQRPRVEPRVVAVVEHDANGVTADGLDACDVHAFLARDEHALAGRKIGR